MSEKIYRVAIIKIGKSKNEYTYLCELNNINSNDWVFVEGVDFPVYVKEIQYQKETELLFPIERYKKVINLAQFEFDEDLSGEPVLETSNSEKENIEEKVNVEEDSEEETVMQAGTYVDLKIEKYFSYIDYHTDCYMKNEDNVNATEFSFIKQIKIINNSPNEYEQIRLKFIFSNDIFNISDLLADNVDSFGSILLKIPFLKVEKKLLEEINEQEPASLRIELYDNVKNEFISQIDHTFSILPISQPSPLINYEERLYAKYVTPNAASVKQITLNAVKHNNDQPIITYQNSGPNKINKMLEEAQAIYIALHQWGIVYQNPPAGTLRNQRVRMPDEVLRDKKGTCLDLSILYCACLEEVGFHSILVLIEGHAFAGFFYDESMAFKNAIETQSGLVFNYSTNAMNKLALVECTTLKSSSDLSFSDALAIGQSHLRKYDKEVFSAIDIYRAHKGIFLPIATFGIYPDLELVVKPKEITDTDIDTVLERQYLNVLRDFEKDRFTFWERKLLDLTEANPLVNFKLKSSNCVKMTSDSNIYELLQNNESLKFYCLQVEKDSSIVSSIEEEFIKGTLKPSKIFDESFDKDKMLGIGFEKTLKTMIKKSNSAMDETGAPTLYICLGTLTYSRKKGHTKGYAPFMVLPIKITKDKMGPFYTMIYDYEDIMINETFFEYYKQEHPGVDFEQLYKINPTDNYLDIVSTFMNNNSEDIQLDPDAYFIANLTFAHYIMWQDVRKRKPELKKNKVIQSILENKNMLSDDFTDLDKEIDEVEQYHNFAAPLYYDSTQLKAILKCGEGKSFILDGPPGTGKSQTIVNMIVNAFYHGKTVLFVAEKKAALDVVADRLKKLGDPNSENNLARFCLELHSNKANKADFFNKIKDSMELGVTKNPEEFEKHCKILETKRDEVLNLINKMHEKKYFYSLYDSILTKESFENYDFKVDLNEEFLTNLSQDKIDEINNLIDDYRSTASHIKNFNQTPIKVIQKDDINHFDKENIIKEFNNIHNLLSQFLDGYRNILNTIKLNYIPNQKNIKTVLKLIDLSLNYHIYVNAIDKYLNVNNDEKIKKIFIVTHKLVKLKNIIKDIFNLDLLNKINASIALQDLSVQCGFFKRSIINRKYKKILKTVVLPKFKIKSKELIKLFTYISDYNKMDDYLKINNKMITEKISMNYYENYNNVDQIEKDYNNTKEFIEEIKCITDNESFMEYLNCFMNLSINKLPTVKIQYNLLMELYENYVNSEKTLNNCYKIDYSKYANIIDNVIIYNELLEYVINYENFNDLIDLASINKISNKLRHLGLEQFIDALMINQFDYEDFKQIFELSCAEGFLRLYFKDDDINYFNPNKFESEVNKYKALINEYNSLVVECVSAKLTNNLNHQNINYANSSPIGRLKKSISSNGRGVSIRDTLLNYDDIIKKYFPCFLMSPLSAAQYLAVDEEKGRTVSKFDIVIFDEASQIPTHEAVGPIARGKSLIVAGDPEQMPPSAYFSAGLELAEDEVQYEDATSLLDECIAIELPRIQLAYHYRSKHESLISFSNHNFYKDNLYTFPSPNTKSSMIEFNHVELKENKKDSNITNEELSLICDKFADIYRSENTNMKSVGIIVFNMKQQEKVFDAITELLQKDKKLAEQVDKAQQRTKEFWFVKSLENVQGDERDIIILSIGFRKNATGRATVVGPLARENGQRRLNVAVSRSKEKMIVISTIKYTDFEQDEKIKNKGQLVLKKFLQYAENDEYSSDSSNKTNLSISSFIKQDLEEKGYNVIENVGNSEFRVNLAIVSPDNKYYQLGIIVDSKKIGDKISCRDKLYVQDSVLNGLRWKIINISSLEYYKDKVGTIDKIVKALDKPFVENDNETKFNIEKVKQSEFHYNTIDYVKYRYNNRISYYNEYGFDRKTSSFLMELIKTEYPISFNTIKKRIKEYSNIQSMSDKASSYLQKILNSLPIDKTKDQNREVFYWTQDSSKNISKLKKCGSRDIYDISKEEILKAMLLVIEVQGSLSEEDLFRCTLEVLEYGQATLNSKNNNRLSYVYNWAISKGYLKK